jgi:hypothetical protein
MTVPVHFRSGLRCVRHRCERRSQEPASETTRRDTLATLGAYAGLFNDDLDHVAEALSNARQVATVIIHEGQTRTHLHQG